VEDLVILCPICHKALLPGEPYAQQGGFYYHLTCFRRVGAKKKFGKWLEEVLQKNGRMSKAELLRKAWEEGYGVNEDLVSYFLSPLVREGLVKEEKEYISWVEKEKEVPLSELVKKKKLEPRVKPPNVLV
jgi:hypothetical protein